MAENKKSFVLYADLIKSIEHLTNEEKGILFNHLLEYVNDMKPVLTDRLILTAWKPIELQLKRDLIKFEEVKVKRSEAGKRSAELRALKSDEQSSTNSTLVKSVQHRSTNSTDNVNDNDNVNVINNIYKFDFKKSCISYGFELQLVNDWMKVRKAKDGINTETAFKKFINEVEKTKRDKNEILKIVVENSWKGFKAEWIKQEEKQYSDPYVEHVAKQLEKINKQL